MIDPTEAERARDIFGLYQRHGLLLPVVTELGRRGWVTKRWADKACRVTGGKSFTRTNLYQLLTNPLYAGRVRYKADVFPGEHPALVDPAPSIGCRSGSARIGHRARAPAHPSGTAP